jgi:hypothetical protein
MARTTADLEFRILLQNSVFSSFADLFLRFCCWFRSFEVAAIQAPSMAVETFVFCLPNSSMFGEPGV